VIKQNILAKDFILNTVPFMKDQVIIARNAKRSHAPNNIAN
jgi:hypothetical protein